MKRLLSVLVLCLSLAPFASADVIDASERGFVTAFNNGAAPNNSYFAGTQGAGSSYRNWFEFDIPTLTGPLLSATLNLDEPTPFGHLGGSLTYTVYGLDARPLTVGDVTTSNTFALPVTTSNADTGTTISITLNSAARAAIVAHQGGHIFIGGVDSAEGGPTLAGDFGSTLDKGVTSLSLTVPEPAPIVELTSLLIGSLLIVWMVALRRKTRHAG